MLPKDILWLVPRLDFHAGDLLDSRPPVPERWRTRILRSGHLARHAVWVVRHRWGAEDMRTLFFQRILLPLGWRLLRPLQRAVDVEAWRSKVLWHPQVRRVEGRRLLQGGVRTPGPRADGSRKRSNRVHVTLHDHDHNQPRRAKLQEGHVLLHEIPQSQVLLRKLRLRRQSTGLRGL